jgi:transcriptional regulator with XRE-family HTH domain
MSALGQQIRRLRTQAGLTQNALAQAVGLSGNSLISRIESGRTHPTDRVLSDLARFFDLDTEALLALRTTESDSGHSMSLELDRMSQEARKAREKLHATVDEISEQLEGHREVLSTFLLASKLNLVWSLPQKLKREARAQCVWVLSPSLVSETQIPEIRAVVKANLSRGVSYRYLIPDRAKVIRAVQKFQRGLPMPMEVRAVRPELFSFVVETVIYDPQTEERTGLMVAPMKRAEFDIVLGASAAEQYERAFVRYWRDARRVPRRSEK